MGKKLLPSLLIISVIFIAGCASSSNSSNQQNQNPPTTTKLCGDWPQAWPEHMRPSGSVSVIPASSIPDWFPKDFPIFSGAAVVATYSNEAAVRLGKGGTIFLCTDATHNDVANFYRTTNSTWQVIPSEFETYMTAMAVRTTDTTPATDIIQMTAEKSGPKTLIMIFEVKR